jgi:hypothetical protein
VDTVRGVQRAPITAAAGSLAVVVAVASLALTACSSSTAGPVLSTAASAATGSTTAAASPSPSPSVTPTSDTGIAADASPLSGRPGGAGKKVLVVKFDNTTFAQPHSGLKDADIVYVEEVEYGLTRIAAVFSTTLPKVVGPVRSARISDIDLLAQFGKPAFAYSGSQHLLRPVLARASLYDVSGDTGPRGYVRDSSRKAPYNFMGKPALLLDRAPRASVAKDIGFVFSTTTPAGGKAVKVATAPYPASQAQFVWNPASASFDVRLNGKPARASEGGTQHATTVVLQYVRQTDSGYHDKFSGHTPKLDTVGTGKGWVLRDGKAFAVTWSRPSATGGTTFTGADGQVVTFAPGQVWVALVNNRSKVALA